MDDVNDQMYRGSLYPVIVSAETITNGNQNRIVQAPGPTLLQTPGPTLLQTPGPTLLQIPRTRKDQTEFIGLMDRRTRRQDQQQQRSRRCSSPGPWILFKMVFIATTAFLAAALIWRNFNYDGADTHEQARGFLCVRQFFKYLRTPAEQFAFARATYQIEEEESVKTNETVRGNITCHFHCYDNQTGFNTSAQNLPLATSPIPPCLKVFLPTAKRKSMEAATVGSIHYHGCCQSQTYFQSPPTAEGTDGKVKTLATFGNRSQYFKTQDCKQVSGCTGCTCTTIMEVFTALVINRYGGLQLSDIKLRGCCKCFRGR
ncbi:uncharacterized protein LOC126807972 [Patella vulgata]|uniref:uncharacterized protein LOC126807972 n=1 Tax=Patella vulgata TaxID=6465 RepID=UPI0024A8787E|nr:uncharacterized protein LOC126807972 [Patella vulgata]